MFYVYIIYSERGKCYYIGQTNNLKERMRRHNDGGAKFTRKYIPWVFVLGIEKQSRSDAMILEKKLKNLNTEDLQKFINKYSNQQTVIFLE